MGKTENKFGNKFENKTGYMNALRQELDGLPADTIEDCMWSYEGKFIDAMLAGRSEAEIVASLPAPALVAAQKRAGIRRARVGSTVSKAASLLPGALGVLVFNCFMLIPAFMYSAILFAAYLSSLAFYVAGIVITAASLSGVTQIKFDLPLSQAPTSSMASAAGADTVVKPEVKLVISPEGIVVDDDGISAVSIPGQVSPAPSTFQVEIENHVTSENTFQGLGLLAGGIALLMLSLWMTRSSYRGLKNYLQWNFSLLRAPVTAAA
ncbi:DUF1700 domain-containing protein [Undibacterium piscinae]|jgi:uncharacterized membrane protein|uniref:DUF1700 domain-containing protein n=1 Tax=Undibacterium piscinae TaxID=2495591 RepID=A0A6M4A5U1_9BURK|nr:DUF1700 domain-containing protein [Undibacterium piscinae]